MPSAHFPERGEGKPTVAIFLSAYTVCAQPIHDSTVSTLTMTHGYSQFGEGTVRSKAHG